MKVLALLEVRQHVLVAPAGVAERLPLVEILRVASHVQHVVQDAGTAETLAARPSRLPVGHGAHAVHLRLALVLPIVRGQLWTFE